LGGRSTGQGRPTGPGRVGRLLSGKPTGRM